MIATHNIKVNGRWVRAGENYEPVTVQTVMPVEPETTEAQETEKQEEPKAAPRAKSTSRRKTTK